MRLRLREGPHEVAEIESGLDVWIGGGEVQTSSRLGSRNVGGLGARISKYTARTGGRADHADRMLWSGVAQSFRVVGERDGVDVKHEVCDSGEREQRKGR